jgi:hypothetical protein
MKMQGVVRFFSAWAVVVATASAFQPALSKNGIQAKSCRQSNNLPRSNRRQSTMRQSNDLLLAEVEEQEEMIDFFVSPVQIAFLRKEANKRESNKRLLKFSLPPQETAEISPETIDEIFNLFDKSELIEVRGVSKDAKKKVFDSAHGLAATLEDALEMPVVVVDIKGFAVKLYCPWDDDEQGGRGGRIQLRTNYRPGQWMRKAKPIRDNRGQIITDEDGMSVKEIPE